MLKNFRLFKLAEIQFSKLSVFIGQNSSGKSSIADLILFLSDLFAYYHYRSTPNGTADKLGRSISRDVMSFFPVGNTDILSIRIHIKLNELKYVYQLDLKPDYPHDKALIDKEILIISSENTTIFNSNLTTSPPKKSIHK